MGADGGAEAEEETATDRTFGEARERADRRRVGQGISTARVEPVRYRSSCVCACTWQNSKGESIEG